MNLFGHGALLFDNPVYFIAVAHALARLFDTVDEYMLNNDSALTGPVQLHFALQLYGPQTQESHSLEGCTVFCDLL